MTDVLLMIFGGALSCVVIGFALGMAIGHGRKISAAERAAISAAASTCPNCHKPFRDAKGHYLKSGQHAEAIKGTGCSE